MELDIKRTAYHEAGHAAMLLIMYQKCHILPGELTIVPCEGTRGSLEYFNRYDLDDEDCEDEERIDYHAAAMAITISGVVAEKISGLHVDGEDWLIAPHFDDLMKYDEASHPLEELTGGEFSSDQLYDIGWDYADELLRRHWNLVEKIANTLLDKKTINGTELICFRFECSEAIDAEAHFIDYARSRLPRITLDLDKWEPNEDDITYIMGFLRGSANTLRRIDHERSTKFRSLLANVKRNGITAKNRKRVQEAIKVLFDAYPGGEIEKHRPQEAPFVKRILGVDLVLPEKM